jgi:hypothetical protein
MRLADLDEAWFLVQMADALMTAAMGLADLRFEITDLRFES